MPPVAGSKLSPAGSAGSMANDAVPVRFTPDGSTGATATPTVVASDGDGYANAGAPKPKRTYADPEVAPLFAANSPAVITSGRPSALKSPPEPTDRPMLSPAAAPSMR